MARVAIVTGGTRGIGEAISIALRDQGDLAVVVGSYVRAGLGRQHGEGFPNAGRGAD